MVFKIPNQIAVRNANTSLMQTLIPEINPSLPQSWSGWLNDTLSLGESLLNDKAVEIYKDNFYSTASRDALIIKGTDDGLPPLQPQSASGILISQTDMSLSNIPAGSEFTILGIIYISSFASISSLKNKAIAFDSTYSLVTELSTVITVDIHNFISGITIAVDGDDYIVVNIIDEFTFTVEGDETLNFLQADIIELISFQINVVASITGIITNVVSDTLATTGVTQITNPVRVSYAGLNGGTNTEKTSEYSSRISPTLKGGCVTPQSMRTLLDANGFSYINFNLPTSTEGGDPNVGEVKMYVLRNNDQLTSVNERARIRSLILNTSGFYSITDDESMLFVENAELFDVLFEIQNLQVRTINGLVPASSISGFDDTVRLELQNFFLTEVTIGLNVDEDLYRGAIARSRDGQGNMPVSGFTVNIPVGNIVVNNSQKARFNGANFV